MAEVRAEPSGLGPGTAAGGTPIQPSLWSSLPHFLPLLVFPLIVNAAMQGGWWIAAPFVFFMLAGPLDIALGADERNMDPVKTPERRLFWHNLPVWGWAFLWLATFAFMLWQILVAGHLALWEGALMAVVLAGEAQAVFIVGHELVHRRRAWERRLGEFLLASASYPHYATEHVYIHHALVGTLALNGIDVLHWLEAWLEACAKNAGRPPDDLSPWLPWSMNEERRRAFMAAG